MTMVHANVERGLKNVLVVVKKSACQTAVDTNDQLAYVDPSVNDAAIAKQAKRALLQA